MKISIPDNLTYEQFKALADRKPSLEGNWIYRLTHETVRGDYKYPEFLSHQSRYMFMSLTEAEKLMRERLITKYERYQTYRFLIEQLPVGVRETALGAVWVYDKNGELIEMSSTVSEGGFPDSYFFGRSKDRIRFHEGDIVEIVDGDSVHLAIVLDEVPSLEQFWKMYVDSKDKTYYSDRYDECYYVVNGPGSHTHSHVTNVMKPLLPIPQDVREYFQESLAISKKKEDGYDPFRLTMESGNIFDAAEIGIKLSYDSSLKRHKLLLQTTDNVTDSESERVLPQDFSEDELRHIAEWLNYKKYGKSRLWYLIREWNEYFSSDNRPALSPDTPLEELIKY